MANIASVLALFTDTTILYWAKQPAGGSFGKPLYAQAVEVLVRWEDKEQEIILPDSRRVRSSGYVLLGSPILVGSLLWLGDTAAWQAQPFYPNIPTVNQGAREVLKCNRTPGLPQFPGNVYEVYL